jgi:hypothetical protein
METSSPLPRYVGTELPNPDYHHGQLRLAVGTHNVQVVRANRTRPAWSDGTGWTYNHAPMLAYWNGQFWLEYLSEPVSEREPPGQTLLTASPDGLHWAAPRVAFPVYSFPPGVYRGSEPISLGHTAVMHQRMGFYVAPNDRLLVLGFYGICPNLATGPNDGLGIGRVVREVHRDGSMGPIYFIRYNRHAGWNESNTSYSLYTAAPDPGFVAACNALLADRLMTLQWWEEDRSADGFYAVEGYKALSFYHLPDGRAVGLWKNAKAALTADEGHTWSPVSDVPSLVNATNKIWGQRTADGRYALVWTPTRDAFHRWPLAITTSDDGLNFDQLLTVAGEVSPIRFRGRTKDFGLGYVRGIVEGNGTPPGGALWLTYSMNKEDIWVCRVPVPPRDRVEQPVHDQFDDVPAGDVIPDWNIYSPVWCRVAVVEFPSATDKSLELRDQDPYDHAAAERVFPESARVKVQLRLLARSPDKGELHIELSDRRGTAAVCLVIAADGWLKARDGGHWRRVQPIGARRWYDLEISADCAHSQYTLSLDGQPPFRGGYALAGGAYFAAPVLTLERLTVRTGPRRRWPDTDSDRWAQQDMPGADVPVDPAVYYLNRLSTVHPPNG